MLHAVIDSKPGVLNDIRSIHWLQEEVVEFHRLEILGHGPRLGKYEFDLVAGCLDERRSCLGTHADPVERVRGGPRSVGLNRDSESRIMQSVDERLIYLKQWLATGAND